MPHLRRWLTLGVLLVGAVPSLAHVVLDQETIHGILVEIARDRGAFRQAADREARAETLYRLGEKVQGLVELLNQDLSSHGTSDLFSRLLLKRLEAYGVVVVFQEPERRYAYDLAAFREYLELAPEGKQAPDARFQLIARSFYETLGTDPAKLVKTDVAGLMRAVAEEERFLRDYPQHGRAKEVLFFAGVDHYRLYRSVKDPDQMKKYEGRSREALETVVARYPGSIEARAAETLLEGLRAAGGN